MDRDVFWSLIEEARARAGDRADDHGEGSPLPGALVDVLAERLSPEAILAFSETSDVVRAEADLWDLVAACYLIERYVSDDHFSDFRDGLILLGRDVFTRTIQDPDSLAGHVLLTGQSVRPAAVVTDSAARFAGRVEVAYESIAGLSVEAWSRLTGQDEEDFWEALMRRRAEADAGERPRPRPDYTDRWDLADAAEFGRRLPRLVGLLSIPQPM
jgi:hypothetical protein